MPSDAISVSTVNTSVMSTKFTAKKELTQCELAVVVDMGSISIAETGRLQGEVLQRTRDFATRVQIPLCVISSAALTALETAGETDETGSIDDEGLADVRNCMLIVPEVSIQLAPLFATKLSHSIRRSGNRARTWVLHQADLELGNRIVLSRFVTGHGALLAQGSHNGVRFRDVYVQKLLAAVEMSNRSRAIVWTEARLLRDLRDPHVTDFFGVVPTGKVTFVYESWGSATQLSTLLSSPPATLTLRARASILSQVLQGLQAIHGRGVLHGDLTPEFVLVDMEAEGGAFPTRITNYGFHACKSSGATLTVSKKEVTVAPEIMRGLPASFASDVYAWAVLAHWTLSGSEPFSDLNLFAFISSLTSPTAADFLQRNFALDLIPQPHPSWISLLPDILIPDPDDRPTLSSFLTRVMQ